MPQRRIECEGAGAGDRASGPGRGAGASRRRDTASAGDRWTQIKIDVEGFELRVLRGLADTIRRFKPKILCEFNPMCIREQAETGSGIDFPDGPYLRARPPWRRWSSMTARLGLNRPQIRANSCGSGRRATRIDAHGGGPASPPPPPPPSLVGWVHFDILFDTAAK